MRNKINAPTPNEDRVIKFLILLGVLSIINFLFFFLQPESRGNIILYVLLSISLLYGIVKKIYLWYNYANISVPEKPEAKDYTVDVLTTYFPGEPYQMIVTTLEAIVNIKYPHETYLCDEANDPYLKEFCSKHGIHHVTRDNRIDAKAGNINNALRKEAKGEIAVILDPDHIPNPDFLDKVMPYFSNPEIGFVQTVQGYYNTKETLVARGAAEQTFQFYGPMMMTLNSYGAVNAIGANCVFRREALDSIGGHAPGLCEDMHTAMKLYSKNWKAVYLPEILAQGLAPSNLTSYFKQQLKWARGTFDLLFKVYPKLFRNFTVRQKIHFGILPLHYLKGLICLINFLIPIFSLLFSTTPWKGNIIDFGLMILPVIVSSILIRTYIQKWVIEQKERGFHLIGGLLEINTWWIYILGFFYTLIDKKIPYLPTPKENEFATNLKIIIPNAVLAFISVVSVFIGLSRDFTPFMIFMSGFAIFNALIMLFGIYLAVRKTNENNILKENLNRNVIRNLNSFKFKVFDAGNFLFTITRFLALPLLMIILFSAIGLKQQNDEAKWDNLVSEKTTTEDSYLLGIFYPSRDTGTVDFNKIHQVEKHQKVNFDLISMYLSWDVKRQNNFPHEQLDAIRQNKAFPMITWEPWINSTASNQNFNILEKIANGDYDDYIKYFGQELANYNAPVFIRFAHEFDNPQYPWSKSSGNHSEDFKNAWKNVYRIIKEQGAHKVIFVWNPWQSETMHDFYPGDNYVDWIGITLLNYGPLNKYGRDVSFENLYTSFHEKLFWFTNKPVMLTEFGSIKSSEEEQAQWLEKASVTIDKKFPNIHGLVFFNSAFDNNIPVGKSYPEKYIDWTTDSIKLFQSGYSKQIDRSFSFPSNKKYSNTEKLDFKEKISGVRYKKGLDWKSNYYVLSRKTLLRDFELMKKMGINTIFYQGGNVYDYNTLKYSKKQDINLIYDFRNYNAVEYLNNETKLAEIENAVISKVRDLTILSNLTALSFNMPNESELLKPDLFDKRAKMVAWLTSVLPKIKSINKDIPIILNLELNKDTNRLISELNSVLPIDYFGLIVQQDKESLLENTTNFAKEKELNLLISSISPEEFTSKNLESHYILENWQDERFSDWLSFNGILDFDGRIKKSFPAADGKLENLRKNYNFKILKPAIPLIPGEQTTYHAMLLQQEQWIYGSKLGDTELKFEWTLIKKDEYGNELALKKLGKGPSVTLDIPANYKNYELLLTLIHTKTNYVQQTFSILHTRTNTEN